jgi:tetratricopeptide (TPR) repeat protein
MGRKKRAEGGDGGGMPPRLVMESMMAGITGSQDPRYLAQDLMYQAMEEESPERIADLTKRALSLNPRCVDALVMVAEATSRNDAELAEGLSAAVMAGEEDLGEKFFREYRRMFWGMIETRPYMRARGQLAAVLSRLGRPREAIGHWEEMLELNPGDNQGVRYSLLAEYLLVDRTEAARGLLLRYGEDGSAVFGFGQLLLDLLYNDEEKAARSLKKARSRNAFAEDYLTGAKHMPDEPPEYYSPGQENEGIVCALELGKAWKKHRRALKWLKGMRKGEGGHG